MILSNRIRRTFFVLSSIFFAISLTGCAGLGGGGGSGLVDGGAGGLANLGANDVAAWDIWFETNGQRNSQPVVGEPGNLVLDVINSFPRIVTLHVQWFEDGVLREQRNYDIPIGESPVSAGYAFAAEGDHTIMAQITLVDPAVAEEPTNNQVSAPINVQAVGANPPPAGGGGRQPVQGVDLAWGGLRMLDAARNVVTEPIVGQSVEIDSWSYNLGSTTAQNITRVLTIDDHEVYRDPAPQSLASRQHSAFVMEHAFDQAGPHTLIFKMEGFTPPQAADARGTNPLTKTVNVRGGMTPVVGTPPLGTVNTDESHDLKFVEALYFQNGYTDANGTSHDPSTDQSAIYPGLEGGFRGVVLNATNYNESNVGVSVKVNGHVVSGGDITLAHVPANSRSAWFEIPYKFTDPGSYQVTYELDLQNRIRETNENNNREERVVSVSNPRILSRGGRNDL
ncbi:MAG: CARDB domain-containing protein, partial [Deltaproteobacteria bacterium]